MVNYDLEDSLEIVEALAEKVDEIGCALEILKDQIKTAIKKTNYEESLELSTAALDITPRLYKLLASYDIWKVKTIVDKWDKLPKYAGFGKKSLEELSDALREIRIDMPKVTVPSGKSCKSF